MNKSLKQILINIARLPNNDQRWIIQHLSPEQRLKFEKLQGATLLKQARRFKAVPYRPTKPAEKEATPPLPNNGLLLATHAPLYIAIILEQGAYPWTNQFLKQFDHDNRILIALEQQTPRIQSLVKQALYHEWKQQSSFDILLENQHG
jgi:hypothetical protein